MAQRKRNADERNAASPGRPLLDGTQEVDLAALPGREAGGSTRLLSVLALAYCFGTVLLGVAFTALAPEPTDAHLFAHIGRQWLHGQLPYVDIWDNKPPGIFAFIAVVFAFLPDSFATLAAAEAVFSIASLGLVYALCRRCGLGQEAALLSMVLAAGASHLIEYTERGVLPELYLALPALASMYCFVAAYPKLEAKWIFLAGLFAGVASVFKPTGLSPLFAQIGFLGLIAFMGRVGLVRLSATASLLVIGAVAAWLPAVLYFMKVGGLAEMLVGSFTYNLEYGLASQERVTATFFGMVDRLRPIVTLVSAAVLLGYLWLTWASRHGQRTLEVLWEAHRVPIVTALILGWCLVDLAGALAGGRGYGHYFLPLATSMAVAAGFAYSWVIYPSPPPARLRTTTALLLMAPILAAQAGDIWLLNQDARWGREEDGAVTAGKYLRSISEPENTLFVWNYMPAVYFYSALASPVRLLHAHHMEDSPAAYDRFGPVILSELRAALPTFIVDAAKGSSASEWTDPFYAEFRQLIETHYHLIEAIPHRRVNIYRRNAVP